MNEEVKVLHKFTFAALQAILPSVGNGWEHFPQRHFICFGNSEDDFISIGISGIQYC